MHAALPLRFTSTLPRRCMQVFVVLLRFFCDDGKEKRLLPCGRLPRSIKPSVGGLPWTTQSGNDHGGGIRGERISEGHGQILPQKKKYAMQKINLAKCPQCRQSLRMSNTNNNTKYNLFISFNSDLNGWTWESWEGSKILGRNKREGLSYNDAHFFSKLWLKRQMAWDKAAA